MADESAAVGPRDPERGNAWMGADRDHAFTIGVWTSGVCLLATLPVGRCERIVTIALLPASTYDDLRCGLGDALRSEHERAWQPEAARDGSPGTARPARTPEHAPAGARHGREARHAPTAAGRHGARHPPRRMDLLHEQRVPGHERRRRMAGSVIRPIVMIKVLASKLRGRSLTTTSLRSQEDGCGRRMIGA